MHVVKPAITGDEPGGDLRYVSDAEFAAFRDMESPTQRQLAYDEFRPSQRALALSFLGGGIIGG